MIKNFFITAYRNLARNKMYALLNIFGLTIGVLVCLVIGVWLQRELSFDNFHPNGDQIFRLSNTFKSESESFSQAPSGPAFGAQLPRQLPSIQSTCRLFPESVKIKVVNDRFVESNCQIVDSNFFSFFGFELKRGQKEKVLLNHDELVLSEKLAIKYFGNTDNAMGKSLLVDGEYPMTVTGVAENPPANSHIQFDMLLSSAYLKKKEKEQNNFDIDNFWVGGWPNTYVRIANPARWKELEKQINEVAKRFSEKEWSKNKMSYQYFLQPVENIHLLSHLRYDAANNGNMSRVNIFSIVGLIVLLLACINYINLTTASAIKRVKEISVRKVVGATKLQLVRQFFVETFLISTLSVLLGVVLIKLLLPSFSQWIDQTYQYELSVKNLLIIFGFIIFISVVAGIYPAIILSSFKPAISLKGNFMLSKKGNLIRKSLVVFQFTIGITLVASLLIISRQMDFIKNKSLGYDDKAVMQIDVGYAPDIAQNYTSLRNELLQSPYIADVCKHNGNVVGGMGNSWTTTENLKGEEISTSLYQFSADTNYFNTYSMKLAAGRFFSANFPTDSTKAVLINEAAVKTFGWQKPENAIGKRFGKGENTRYVVGVIKDFNFESLHKPVEALMIGYARWGSSLSLKIDASHTNEVINHLKKTWKAIVPEVPLQYFFVDEGVVEQYGSEQKMQGLFYGFSVMSLLIACIGLFGLSIFVAERKVKEIGIRKVLGASVTGIVALISKDFLKLVVIAGLIATPLAWVFMHQWLQDFAYRINIGWWIFIIAGLLALLIALTTVSFQAIKAAISNPVKSLRTE